MLIVVVVHVRGIVVIIAVLANVKQVIVVARTMAMIRGLPSRFLMLNCFICANFGASSAQDETQQSAKCQKNPFRAAAPHMRQLRSKNMKNEARKHEIVYASRIPPRPS